MSIEKILAIKKLSASSLPLCFRFFFFSLIEHVFTLKLYTDNPNKKHNQEDHERAATAFASAASALDAVLASVAASHPADRLSALRSEEAALQRELEAKRELVEGVAAKIDGWRRRAKEALSRAEAAAASVGEREQEEARPEREAATIAAAVAAPAGQQ